MLAGQQRAHRDRPVEGVIARGAAGRGAAPRGGRDRRSASCPAGRRDSDRGSRSACRRGRRCPRPATGDRRSSRNSICGTQHATSAMGVEHGDRALEQARQRVVVGRQPHEVGRAGGVEHEAKVGESRRSAPQCRVYRILGSAAAYGASARLPILSVRRRQTTVAAEELLHIAAGSNGLRLQYQADVNTGGDDHYQFPLAIAAGLKIDDVALTQAGRAVPVRWSRSSPDLATVFFGHGVTGEYRLVVSGHVAAVNSASYDLPRLGLAGSDNTPRAALSRRGCPVGNARAGRT